MTVLNARQTMSQESEPHRYAIEVETLKEIEIALITAAEITDEQLKRYRREIPESRHCEKLENELMSFRSMWNKLSEIRRQMKE